MSRKEDEYSRINSNDATDYGAFEDPAGLHYYEDESVGVVSESRQRNTSTIRTVFNIIKTYIGVGILGLPNAWKESGLAGAIVSMAFLAVVSLHCLKLLVESKETLVRRGKNVYTFGDVCVTAFGRFGRLGGILVDSLLVFTQLGFCCSYIIFLGQNTQTILESKLPWQVFAAIWIGAMILLSWIRTLKSLASLATIATFSLIGGLIAILVASMMALYDTTRAGHKPSIKIIDWANLPSMLSIAIFAFEGVGFVIPAQTAIKKPEKYTFTLTFCLVFVSFLYTLFGTLCYVGFGNLTQPQIIDSVLEWAGGNKAWKIIITIVTIGLMAAIAFTYPIQLFVATDILEEHLFNPADKGWKQWWIQNNFRAFLVFLTGIIALTVSQFDLIMGLIGSLGSAPLQFIFPPLIWLLIAWEETGWPKRLLLIFYIIFGILATILGASLNIVKLIDFYKSPK